jgi:hypothetical protein
VPHPGLRRRGACGPWALGERDGDLSVHEDLEPRGDGAGREELAPLRVDERVESPPPAPAGLLHPERDVDTARLQVREAQVLARGCLDDEHLHEGHRGVHGADAVWRVRDGGLSVWLLPPLMGRGSGDGSSVVFKPWEVAQTGKVFSVCG